MLVAQSFNTRQSRELTKFSSWSSLSKSGVPSSSSAVLTRVLLMGFVATVTVGVVPGLVAASGSDGVMAGTMIGAVNFGTAVLPAGGRRTMFPTADAGGGMLPLLAGIMIQNYALSGWTTGKKHNSNSATD